MKAVLLAAHALAAGSSVISTDAVDASFRYEAAEATERRPAAPRTVGRREDRILTPPKRRAATDRSRDQARNFPLWQWAINTHLDYVTGFSFQSRSGDDGWDREFERYIEIESQPENFDAAGRLSRQEYMRMAEGLVLLDGDCLSLPLRDGTMQLIPAELIDNPPASERRDGDAWEQGVRVGPGGRPLAYGVHRYGRQGGRKEYDRVVSARRAIPLGHFTMPGQMRGITPLISSIAPAQDVRDGMRYALSKMQIAQMLGFVIVKKAIDNYDPEDTDDEADGETEGGGEGTEGETTETTESDAAAEEGRQFKLEHDRVFGAELEAGEDIRSFESKTPSNEFQSYTQVNFELILKPLDIPYSFYNESYTNFAGSRGGLMKYVHSLPPKWGRHQKKYRSWTRWKFVTGVASGRLSPPRGKTLGDLPFMWAPKAVRWWDPSKDIRGYLAGVAAGFINPMDVPAEMGTGDWKDNIDGLAKVVKYAKDKHDIDLLYDASVLAHAGGDDA